ncbi:response regulator transcription factor, partial [Vibrio harveyi]|nr:response regulator transcription factor [Vibrio harveyi]
TKEQKVFMYLVQGYSNKEIAGQLSVSLSTVKTHVSHILSKTGKQSRSQLGSLMVE